MLQMFGLDDNKKIGMFLIVISGVFYMLGIMLLFKRSLILLSNVLFLFGLYFFIGISGIVKFFTKKGKIKGSVIYFTGFVLIVLGMSFFGSVAEIIGFLIIFRSFLPQFYDYICRTPIVGKYLKSYWLQNTLDKLAGNQQSRI